MAEKKIPNKRKTTHSFSHGDFTRIAQLSGYSYIYVYRVLVHKDRSNKKIVKIANKIIKFNQSLKTA